MTAEAMRAEDDAAWRERLRAERADRLCRRAGEARAMATAAQELHDAGRDR